jgi:DNA-binding NtrC family response regulator
MSSRAQVLVFCCQEEDIEALRRAAGPQGPALLIAESPVAVTHHVVAGHPLAVFLGVGNSTLEHLDLIPVIHAARRELPVIVIAEEDSLELERKARQKSIFYYLVHPVDPQEIEAVLKDVLRHVKS